MFALSPRGSHHGARAPKQCARQGSGRKRGINLSHWFAQDYDGYPAGPIWNGFVTRDDIRQLALAGFDHVRLSVAPALLFPPDPMAMVALHRALDHIQQAGLAAVVDLHPVGNEKNLFLGPEGADRLVDCCRVLATALAKRQTPGLALEILNEPEPLAGTPGGCCKSGR